MHKKAYGRELLRGMLCQCLPVCSLLQKAEKNTAAKYLPGQELSSRHLHG